MTEHTAVDKISLRRGILYTSHQLKVAYYKNLKVNQNENKERGDILLFIRPNEIQLNEN